MRLLASGEERAGLVALRRAETLYVGDYLGEYPEGDWVVARREELRATYLTAATRLAARAEADGDHDAAIRQHLRILEHDRYDERAHLGVVRSLAADGHHGAARRMYGVYAARMAELDIEPEPYPG